MVTANEDLTDRLWMLYLQLPEERLILMRVKFDHCCAVLFSPVGTTQSSNCHRGSKHCRCHVCFYSEQPEWKQIPNVCVGLLLFVQSEDGKAPVPHVTARLSPRPI